MSITSINLSSLVQRRKQCSLCELWYRWKSTERVKWRVAGWYCKWCMNSDFPVWYEGLQSDNTQTHSLESIKNSLNIRIKAKHVRTCFWTYLLKIFINFIIASRSPTLIPNQNTLIPPFSYIRHSLYLSLHVKCTLCLSNFGHNWYG